MIKHSYLVEYYLPDSNVRRLVLTMEGEEPETAKGAALGAAPSDATIERVEKIETTDQ